MPVIAAHMQCDDLESTMAELGAKGIEFRSEPADQGFGIVTTMLLPGGVEVPLYEAKHSSPLEKAGGIEQA